MRFLITILFLALINSGCTKKQIDTNPFNKSNVTVATIQKKITVGMTNSEVIEALGSPNVITTDENRCEIWVYDRISTTNVDITRGSALLIVYNHNSKKTTERRTLTILIKFNKNGLVRDFKYHATRF